MEHRNTRVLVVERNLDLCDLEVAILEVAGYDVHAVPPSIDPIEHAIQTQPNVIVVDIRTGALSVVVPTEPAGWDLVDGLRMNPATRGIPVVVTSVEERVVAESRAAPNVRGSVLMPFDLDTFVAAVSDARANPPPAALLPGPKGMVPPGVRLATDLLIQQTREIVLQTLRQLSEIEPYRSRDHALRPSCIVDLPTVCDAIFDGIERSLSATDVFAVPSICESTRRHILSHGAQGLDSASVILEYQLLRRDTKHLLGEKMGPAGISAMDAHRTIQQVDCFFDYLTRIVARSFPDRRHFQRAA